MTVSSLITTASAGLAATQLKIANATANIANADTAGYSRTTVSTATVSTTKAVSEATVTRAGSAILSKLVLSAATTAGLASTLSASLSIYDTALGATAQGDDIASLISTFASSLTRLASDTGVTAKATTIAAADNLVGGLRGLSASIQDLRAQADQGVANAVDAINGHLTKLAGLNDQIMAATAQGGDISCLLDQRDQALSALSGLMGVNAYTTSDNRLVVYSEGGDLLLGTSAQLLSFSASGAVTAASAYPATLSGVTIGGKDVTASLTSGALGAHLALRDAILPAEQEKLDALAGALIETVNTILGQAASATTRATSAIDGLSADTPLDLSGALRVVLVDESGRAQGDPIDIDLSDIGDVQDLLDRLNGIDGIEARLEAGRLTITRADGGRLVLSDLDGGENGAMATLGFNALFTGDGASNIAVNASLLSDPAALATAARPNADIAAGDIVVASADGSTATRLSAALNTARAWDDKSGSSSIAAYAAGFVSAAATLISTAQSRDEAASATLAAASSRLANLTGVNLDEELASLLQYRQQYEANAQMIAMARALFDALLDMVR